MTMKKTTLTKLALALCSTAFAGNLMAATCIDKKANFSLGVSMGSSSECINTSTADKFIDALASKGLKSIMGGTYDGTQAISFDGNFNSLKMSMGFNTANNSQLDFSIPALGINKSFDGGDRDASQRLLKDYLKKSDIIGDIMKYQAENTPNSPLTGAGGLLPTMVATDFDQSLAATNGLNAAQQENAKNMVGLSVSYSSLSALERDTKVTSLPLSYSFRNKDNPGRQLIISMPVTQIETEGAKSYHLAPGIAYRIPVNDAWALTPGIRASAVGSEDLATVAGMYSGSLSSTYTWQPNHLSITMGNMVSHSRTMKVKTGDYSFNPDIQSTVFRNGVMLSQPLAWFKNSLSLQYSLTDTRYTGDRLYITNTQEAGVSIGTNASSADSNNWLRAGISYIRGKDMDGVTMTFGYWF